MTGEGRSRAAEEVGQLIARAERRYHFDAEFHARVHRLTQFMDCNYRERLIVAVALLAESDDASDGARS